jgi:hypothetical protein
VKVRLSVIVAILSGMLALPGYFIPLPFLQGLGAVLLRGAVFLASVALLIGVLNLSRVHLRKTASGKPGGAYSLVLFFSLWITFVVVSYFEPLSLETIWYVRYVQIPLEASLAALILFVLLVGGARLLYRRRDAASILFIGSALVILLATIPLPFLSAEVLASIEDTRNTIASSLMVLAGGGGRGILLGMALGAAATGLRILMGVDRPYDR